MTGDRDSKPHEGVPGSDEGGLEIDERQVREMRSIFGASLPQYIEPLEQTAHLILKRTADPDVVRTFSASATSLREAADKLGFADVSAMISDLDEAVLRVAGQPGEVTREHRHAVLGILDDLRRLGEQLGGSHEKVRGKPLVERLAGMEGAGPIVIQLARAGLVLDEQLLAGRADEIAAVSGLPAATVARVLAWLRGEPAADPAAPAPALAPVPSAAPTPASPSRSEGPTLRPVADAGRDDAPPGADDRLVREIAALESATARLESRLEELRIDLGRGRERLESLRRQQTALDAEVRDLAPAEEELDLWFGMAGELRDRLAAERDLRARALDAARQELLRLRDQVAAIRRSVQNEEENVAAARAALGSLEGMISEIQARASRPGP